MGIAGAGNSGTLIATLFAPRLAQKFGYANTFALAMLPILLVLSFSPFLQKTAQDKEKRRHGAISLLSCVNPDTAWFCFFYCSPSVFRRARQLPHCFLFMTSTPCKSSRWRLHNNRCPRRKFSASVGGFLSDKIGGYRLLLGTAHHFVFDSLCRRHPASLTLEVVLLFFHHGHARHGNGAVFQLFPSASQNVLAFSPGWSVLPVAWRIPSTLSPWSYQGPHWSYSWAFISRGCVSSCCLALLQIGTQWHAKWHEASVDRAAFSLIEKVSNSCSGDGRMMESKKPLEQLSNDSWRCTLLLAIPAFAQQPRAALDETTAYFEKR